MRDRSRIAVHVGLALAALFWAGNFVVGRSVREAIAPLSLNFWRWVLALAILLAFNHRSLWTHRRTLLKYPGIIAALGLTGVASFQTTVYLALETTSALNALLLFTMTPVLIVLGAWLFLHERISLPQVLGMAISLFGAVVLITRGSPDALLGLRFGTGDLWMLLAMVLWAAYSLLLRRRPPELPQLVLLGATTFAAVLMMLPVYLWRHAGEFTALLDARVAGSLLYVAVFASVLAFLLWNSGVARIGPGGAGMYLYLMPVFGALLSVTFLGEAVHAFQLLGGTLVLTGIALVNMRTLPRARTGRRASGG